ncbi:MAG: HypC/HybG/HupF family hydrogenase formation chaperone [Elusimicrobia bacterium]|nr:HypC/HybG/HupF family hydrogenase formation chaperone [Elusimicrobiota bacterium]
MCLGAPGRIIEVNGSVAVADFWGARRQVRLDTVDEPVKPGDYVLVHVGFALRRIPEKEAEETLALYNELIQAEGQ